jgi:2-polyprenyl-3-methyl-5-hydroxy-6-metoxy-1,4-benzoquinol methylase
VISREVVVPYPVHETSVYEVEVDPNAPNHAHSFALGMIGYNKHVLELGCTAGHFTRALVKQGCTVVGVEIERSAAERAIQVAEQVIVADLDDPQALSGLSPGDFDVVTAGDLLEHLRDPLPVLRACRRLLKPSGFVVVSVPNVAHADVRLTLLGGAFPYQASGLLDGTHLRFFTRQNLGDLLWAAGFLPVEIQRVTVPIFETELAVDRTQVPPGLVERILEDPDAQTYQFVVKSVVDDGAASVRTLSKRYQDTEEQLQQKATELLKLRARLEEASAQVEAQVEESVARIAEAEGRVAATVLEAAESADRLAEAERRERDATTELEAFRSTRTFRYTASIRRLYTRLRGVR